MNSTDETAVTAHRINTHEMTLCALFTVLIAAGAFIKIPVPVLPFTLQFLFTTLAGLLLGPSLGTMSVGLYAILGLAGIPIFAEGGGLWYIAKPSFGYILGFIAGTWLSGKIASGVPRPSFGKLLAAAFAGLAVVYIIGMIWYFVICNFIINTPIGLWPLFLYCFILPVPGDFALCFLSAFLARRLRPVMDKMMGGFKYEH